MSPRVVSFLLLLWLGTFQTKGAIIQGPTTTIARPGDDVELVCNVTDVFTNFILWNVNRVRYTRNELFMGMPTGHNISGTNILILDITLGDSRNGSEYYCLLPQGLGTPDLESERAFLYVAGVPDMVINFGVLNNIVNVDGTTQRRNFTLIWEMPFDNLDPILNYTINTTCDDGTVCPAIHVAGSDAVSIVISYPMSIITVNYTVSITANNAVGSSDRDFRILAAPNQIRNVSVTCEPVDLMNQCIVTWDPLVYGPDGVPLAITYTARYNGGKNGTNGTESDADVTMLTFMQPAADGRVVVTMEAENAIGATGVSFSTGADDFFASAVQNTMYTVLDEDAMTDLYDIEVVCEIRPTSTADYCEVFAHGPDSITASATINDDNMASVTVSGLRCEETYTITAGGTFDQTLDGPRFEMTRNAIVGACPTMITVMTSSLVMIPTEVPSETPGPPGESSSDGSSTGAIIGGVCGGIVAVIAIIVIVIVIYFFCCKDRESGSRTMSPSGDKLPVTGAGAGAGRPTSVRVQTLDRYGKPMTDESDGDNVELTDYKPVGSPEFTVNQMPSGNNQLTTKEESRTPSSYMPEGSYDTLAPADEPQGQSAPLTQNGQDQPQKGKLNYAELEQFSRKPASVKKPETQPPSQYAVIDPKSLQGTYT